MKKKDILYLNESHQKVIENLMEDVKAIMYYSTEDEIAGKYIKIYGEQNHHIFQ